MKKLIVVAALISICLGFWLGTIWAGRLYKGTIISQGVQMHHWDYEKDELWDRIKDIQIDISNHEQEVLGLRRDKKVLLSALDYLGLYDHANGRITLRTMGSLTGPSINLNDRGVGP